MAYRVLIVDDTQFMRKMLADCLTQHGYEVAGEANDGREAVLKYTELIPDLVMMDLNMPEMSGTEAIKEIMELDSSAVILVCSAVHQQESIAEAVAAGAKDYVMKPFKTQRVLEIISKYLPPAASEETPPTATVDETPGPSALEPADEAEAEAPAPAQAPAADERPLLPDSAAGSAAEPTTELRPADKPKPPASEKENIVTKLNSPGRNGLLRSFVSSIMCNWQEEINGEAATFTVVCTESENKVVIEMTGDGQEKRTMQFTVDSLRQLGLWLDEHMDRRTAV